MSPVVATYNNGFPKVLGKRMEYDCLLTKLLKLFMNHNKSSW